MDTSCLSTPAWSCKSYRGRKHLRMEQNCKKKKRKLGKDRGEAKVPKKGFSPLPVLAIVYSIVDGK